MKHLPPALQETHKVPRFPHPTRESCLSTCSAESEEATNTGRTQIYRQRFILLYRPHVYTCSHARHSAQGIKLLGGAGRVGFVRSNSQSSLVTSTAVISTSCPSIVPQQRFERCQHISNPQAQKMLHWVNMQFEVGWRRALGLIDWFWPFPRQNLLFTFSSKSWKVLKSLSLPVAFFCLVKNKDMW